MQLVVWRRMGWAGGWGRGFEEERGGRQGKAMASNWWAKIVGQHHPGRPRAAARSGPVHKSLWGPETPGTPGRAISPRFLSSSQVRASARSLTPFRVLWGQSWYGRGSGTYGTKISPYLWKARRQRRGSGVGGRSAGGAGRRGHWHREWGAGARGGACGGGYTGPQPCGTDARHPAGPSRFELPPQKTMRARTHGARPHECRGWLRAVPQRRHVSPGASTPASGASYNTPAVAALTL